MTKSNPSFRVAGVTKTNDQGKDIQDLLKRIAAGYKKNEYIQSWNGYTKKEALEYGMEGSEFDEQTISRIIRLEREPQNIHDPNAIKVFIKDVNDGEHHVGYIRKENTDEVIALTHNKDITGISVEFTGGKNRTIEYDDVADNEYFVEDELTRGLKLIFIYKQEQKPSVITTKQAPTKVEKVEARKNLGEGLQHAGNAMSGCGCLLTIFITVPIILIIIWMLL